jgi:dihydroorotate dehydrogenase
VYRYIIRPFLFIFPPEQAHHLTTRLLHVVLALPGLRWLFRAIFCVNDGRLVREVFGLKFPNPVGLAAGFDKDATMFRDLRELGFGFIEIGTVTPRPQPGNATPRMFRLPDDSGLINRMGFNNKGVDQAVEMLKGRPKDLIIGGNIGKNKDTPNERAVDDYLICFRALHPHVDYFVVNVSSPNTPGLRDLQDRAPLTAILSRLMDENRTFPIQRPILLKIAPDLTDTQLDDIIAIQRDTGIHGIIATNTTISREGLRSKDELTRETGGLSGVPVRNRSTDVIRYLHKKGNGSFPIIGVGGIDGAEAAREKLAAGASLVQVYTGFIYKGPGLVKEILKAL